jgi:hypothetical protein
VISICRARRTMSGNGPSRHFGTTQQFGRWRLQAAI